MGHPHILHLEELSAKDVAAVGGKNASPGELIGSLAPIVGAAVLLGSYAPAAQGAEIIASGSFPDQFGEFLSSTIRTVSLILVWQAGSYRRESIFLRLN